MSWSEDAHHRRRRSHYAWLSHGVRLSGSKER
jgi:hypothetical protein